MTQDSLVWLSQDEKAIITMLRKLQDSRADAKVGAAEVSNAIHASFGLVSISILFERGSTSESEPAMPVHIGKVIQDIVDTDAEIEEKSARLEKTRIENSRLADKLISKLIRSHPNKRSLEKIWGPSP